MMLSTLTSKAQTRLLCSFEACNQHKRSPVLLRRTQSHRQPAVRLAWSGRPRLRCRAADNQEQESAQASESSVAEKQREIERAAAKVREEAEVAKGQRTAVITGAVSIVFGVLYLVLVQFLDSRGGELKPPPPEAFGL